MKSLYVAKVMCRHLPRSKFGISDGLAMAQMVVENAMVIQGYAPN